MSTEAVVDFAAYGINVKDISSVSDETIRNLGKQIIGNFEKFGFCYLKNHGVEADFIEQYMDVSRKFFELPVEVKAKYPMGVDYRFGWTRLEREHLNEKRVAGDLHEAFNYSPFYDTAWPPVEELDVLTKQFDEIGQQLGMRFCDVLSLGLDLPKEFMRNAHKLIGKKGNSSALRTVWYPPIPEGMKVAEDQARIGEHNDWGTVAFNFQDSVGGLEVRNPRGDFVFVDPVPGTVVVTVSALLQRWTADRLQGSMHRILIRDDERRNKTRQSVIWYLQADDDFEIKCLDGSERYKPIQSRAYLQYEADIAIKAWS